MTSRSDAGLWSLAIFASLALHATGFLAAALLQPDKSRGAEVETVVSMLTLPVATKGIVPVSVARPVDDAAAAARLDLPPVEAAQAVRDVNRLAPGTAATSLQPAAAEERAAKTIEPDRLELAANEPAIADRPLAAEHATGALRPSASAAVIPSRREPAATVLVPALPQQEGSVTAQSTEAVIAPVAIAQPTFDPSAERPVAIAPARPPAARQAQARRPEAIRPAAASAERPEPARRPAVAPQAFDRALAPAPLLKDPAPEDAESALRLSSKDVAMLAPANPFAKTEPEPDDGYGRLLEFLKRYKSGGCLVVLPSERPGGAVGLDGFAEESSRLAVLFRGLERVAGRRTQTTAAAVSEAQCRALSFVRNLPGYPAFSLHFEMETRSVASGEVLFGIVRNVDERPLHLLVVDDEGIVQSVDSFLTRKGADASFKAPVTLTGGPVSTVQLLVALASDDHLETVGNMNGSMAESFFHELAEELARRNLSADIAIASFQVN